MELTVDLVERARRRLVADRGAHRLAPDHSSQAEIAHQPFHRASGYVEALALHLPPHFANAVDAEVLGKDPHDLGLESFIASGTC
jgi:hypothetical protein